MFRRKFTPRPDFAARLDSLGFQYHSTKSTDGETYWNEGAAYEFTLAEIEEIETATEVLHGLCMETVADIVATGDYHEAFALSDDSKALIQQTWNGGDIHIYGRFDLQFDPASGAIKMYEYNADTPTALLESAVAQWQWLEEADGVPHRDQFNSIHEKLVDRWAFTKSQVPETMLYVLASKEGPFEDWGNIEYLADTAMQGGWQVHLEEIENLGFDPETNEFVDPDGNAVDHAFKLYPWEWMMDDSFGRNVALSPTQWYEPAWKMLLSNKAILPLLWKRYPDHPNLLPAFFESERPAGSFSHMYVKKPVLGREGANIQMMGTFTDSLVAGSHHVPEYDVNGYIYQEYAPLPEIGGRYPVIGSWVIGDEPAGIGIREDRTIISGNGSHFVPHYFVN